MSIELQSLTRIAHQCARTSRRDLINQGIFRLSGIAVPISEGETGNGGDPVDQRSVEGVSHGRLTLDLPAEQG